MSIRSLLPKFLMVVVLAFAFALASQSAEAARYRGNTSNRYTGAFRGMNNSAAFVANGYRTGMQNPGSLTRSSGRRGFFGRR